MPFSFLKALFADKPKEPEYEHKVWVSHEGKWKGLLGKLQGQTGQGKPVLLMAWFPKTLHNLEYLLKEVGIAYTKELGAVPQQDVYVALADDYLRHAQTGLPNHIAVWMVEHYPIHAPELAVFEKAKQEALATKPIIFASLDERLFNVFGGERIRTMMRQMGGGEDEMIEHALVKSSVVRAQEKVAKDIITELKTQSDEEWFVRNYKKLL